MMGAGKTSLMYDYINANEDRLFILITPYLDEIERAKKATNGRMYDPKNYGKGKLDSLKALLAKGVDIASTHSLFQIVDDEVLALLRQGKYTLIMDECIDVVQEYNETINDRRYFVGSGDVRSLLDDGKIEVGNDGYVKWCGRGEYEDFSYKQIEMFANSGNLICVQNRLFLWVFPHKIFEAFQETFVLTYRFSGSVLACYFRFHNIEYQMQGVKKLPNGQYAFTDYSDDVSLRKKHIAPLINIIEDEALNEIGSGSRSRFKLTMNWYKNCSTDDLARLKRNLNVIIKRRFGVPSLKIMWTVFQEYENTLKSDGAVWATPTTAAEKKLLSKRELNKRKCFVAVNARGTNDFRSRTHLMYLCNRFIKPDITAFFSLKGIVFDDENFALSEMVQWIWRSAIRDGKEIHLYIPSKRMRDLLKNWLGINDT